MTDKAVVEISNCVGSGRVSVEVKLAGRDCALVASAKRFLLHLCVAVMVFFNNLVSSYILIESPRNSWRVFDMLGALIRCKVSLNCLLHRLELLNVGSGLIERHVGCRSVLSCSELLLGCCRLRRVHHGTARLVQICILHLTAFWAHGHVRSWLVKILSEVILA